MIEEKPYMKPENVSSYRFYWPATADLGVREMAYCMFLFVKDTAQTKLSKQRELLICFPVSQPCHISIKILYFHLVKNFHFTIFFCYSLCFDFACSEDYRDPQALFWRTFMQPLELRWLIPSNLWSPMDRPCFTVSYHSKETPTIYLVPIAVFYDMSGKLYFLTGYSSDPFLQISRLDANQLPIFKPFQICS